MYPPTNQILSFISHLRTLSGDVDAREIMWPPSNQILSFISHLRALSGRCRRQGDNVTSIQSDFFFYFSPALPERRCRRQGCNVPFNQSDFFFLSQTISSPNTIRSPCTVSTPQKIRLPDLLAQLDICALSCRSSQLIRSLQAITPPHMYEYIKIRSSENIQISWNNEIISFPPTFRFPPY